MLAGPELDRDVLVEQHVGRTQQVVGGLDVVGEVVDAAARWRRIPGQAEVVAALACRGEAEDDVVGIVRDRRELGVAVAERVAEPAGVAVGARGGDRHVVDAASADTARDEALRAVREWRFLARRGVVKLDLPEDLMQVPTRRAVLVGGAMADGVLAPADPGPGVLEPLDPALELLLAERSPADVRQPGLIALGELQRVVEAVAPAAKVDRLAIARGLLESHHVGPEVQ